MFNVGVGVLQRMQELNDSPVRDSEFVNSTDGKSRGEKGYGITHDYRAVGHLINNVWQWDVYAYKLNLIEQDSAFLVMADVRNKLLVRRDAPPYPVRQLNLVNRFVVHHTAGLRSSMVHQVAEYQTGPNAQLPFPAIAYHFLIEQDGLVNWCHDLNKRTWGSDGGKAPVNINDVSIHACYTGNNNPTDDQIKALHDTRLWCEQQLGRSFQTIEGHRDNDFTVCPGDSWDQWKARI